MRVHSISSLTYLLKELGCKRVKITEQPELATAIIATDRHLTSDEIDIVESRRMIGSRYVYRKLRFWEGWFS